VPKCLPHHWQIVILKAQANYTFDTDPIGITALQPVGDVQRAAPAAFASAAQQPLIPTAGGQLIPDERGNAF
jgi:hypothetical protein